MAKISVPAGASTQVFAGGANAVAFGNGGSNPIVLNTGDIPTDGGLVTLRSGDSIFLAAGSAEAASAWFAFSSIGSTITITEFA